MEKWAILVGVNKYTFVNPLQYSANDAVELSKHFHEDLEFPLDHIIELSDKSKIPPTRDHIFHEVCTLVKSKKVKKDDLLIFFFSGHGMIDKDDRKDYLLPSGASPNALEYTGIRVEQIAGLLKKTECNNPVLFLDACREVTDGAKGVTIKNIGDDSKSISKRTGIVTFFSCDPKDYSYEINELQHSSFTYNIIKAIEEPTCNTVEDLNSYLRQNVVLTNKQYKKPPQVPYCEVAPLEKLKMQLFFNHKQSEVVKSKLETISQTLASLCAQGKLGPKLFQEMMDIFDRYSGGEQDEKHTNAVARITDFCNGIFTEKSITLILQTMFMQQTNQPTIQEPEKLK